MNIKYLKETDPVLITAARKAYADVPPDQTGSRSRFARTLAGAEGGEGGSLAADVRRNDRRVA